MLIIDDDHYVVSFLSMYFKGKGFDVDTASDALQAEKHLTHHPLDVVVLDIRLKDTDGTRLVPIIHQLSPKVPVVMLTGLGYDEKLMQKSLEAGAKGYVSKSLPPEELFAAVLRAMEES
ncbi:MAG: response regulator [Candidatus Methylacidiphilales bacterium]|nr:response regulator [Candidatus Methylacidiphilales bacterium]